MIEVNLALAIAVAYGTGTFVLGMFLGFRIAVKKFRQLLEK